MHPNPETMPIHRECFAHRRFRERLNATTSAANLGNLPTSERLRVHKALIREAALKARDELLVTQPASEFTISMMEFEPLLGVKKTTCFFDF